MTDVGAGVDAGLAKPRPFLAAASLAKREWVRFVRQRNRVVGAIGQPLVFWLLFSAGLGPSFRLSGGEGSSLPYREYFFPGTLVLIVLFTAIFATISVIEDRREGFLQSVLVSPTPRWAMVLGKIFGTALIALAHAVLFLLLGFAIGFSWSAATFLAVVAWLAIVSIGLTALGLVIAWRMESTQGFHAVMSIFLMPLWLLSGAFFPLPPWNAETSGMEMALHVLMRANPLTYGVAGLRRLMYADWTAPPLPADLPSMSASLFWTLAFAGALFLLAWRVAGRSSAGDVI